MVSSRERKLRLLLMAASLLVGLGLVEGLVRLSGVDYNISINWKYHPLLGWSQTPNGRYDYTVEKRGVHVAFNSRGFRDVEHQRKKDGRRRVVVIGDSFCEAVQVNLEETFWKRLETQLDPARWEVINLGVGDFGTAQEYLALEKLGLEYQPDAVILEIFPLNDICNNTIELYGMCRSKNDRYRPYFVESNGDIRLTSAQPVRNFLRRYSVTYGLLEHALSKPDPDSSELWAPFLPLDPLIDGYLADAEQPPSVARGWRVTEKIIARTAALARKNGAVLIAMVAPFEPAVGGNWDVFVDGFHSKLSPIREYPENRLQRLFEREKIPSVSLLDTFARQRTQVLPFVDGHFNREGHLVAAELLYEKMGELGLH
jgi:hypothetical protein